ncbi:hypothetical protein B7R56_23525 [Pseudomonas savastanoi pv. retacarpa]|uniref:DUF1534 domain-containing protein n=1 Tax=Pseudomonas savastanoi pv. nerii TaxID=360921 RepID=A0AB73RP81_PSESS|nr:DUF1534 domain-containing protein [Pseudomonas savastanoi]OSR26045.1 hypothetical protein B7R56_23525 [Pseudomonas savastanoi pv. retacarpa]PAB34405.1 hypothetical protein CCZ00_09375 [Pseudomonas savastanoi pv. fraxini]PAB36554.1 hypothetical protein CC205_07625 [Pseudomonas savastanoi pv. nerii]TSC38408.1 DUF1534 domain-containing protein [Pseudomonas sp. ST1]
MSCGRLSFRTLQRGNAVGDALRHRYARYRTLKIGHSAQSPYFLTLSNKVVLAMPSS